MVTFLVPLGEVASVLPLLQPRKRRQLTGSRNSGSLRLPKLLGFIMDTVLALVKRG
jgi:hypothetical protein